MRIIIVGCGKTGHLLAARLIGQKHDVVIIEKDEEVFRNAKETLDVMAILGDGSSPITLEQATETDSGLLIASTANDQVNTVSCLIAKQYGVPRCIVRINDPDNLVNPLLMDEQEIRLVYPEQIIANELTRMISSYNVTQLNTFIQGRVDLLKIKIEKDSPVAGKQLDKIQLPSSWIFAAIVREKQVSIPHGNTVIMPGDNVVAIGTAETRATMEKFMETNTESVKKVLILGASEIGIHLSSRLVKQGISVRIIEMSSEKAEQLAVDMPEVMVLQGDGTDGELLKEAGVQKTDYFLGLTKDDEVNVLGALLARDLGCSKVAVISRKPQYMGVIKRIGVGEVVSPLNIVVEEMLQFVGRDNIFTTTILENGGAKLIQLKAENASKVVNRTLKEINFPADSLVCMIIRNEEVIIPKGDWDIKENDNVIIITTSETTRKIEALFK